MREHDTARSVPADTDGDTPSVFPRALAALALVPAYTAAVVSFDPSPGEFAVLTAVVPVLTLAVAAPLLTHHRNCRLADE